MNTAQGFYEVYKALPKRTQKQVKHLIENEETIKVSISAIEKGLNEVRLIEEEKLSGKTYAEFKKELKNRKNQQ